MFIYESEINFLTWLVLQNPINETGGDLFGLWHNERTAVVQFILGPGKKCRRTTTSFIKTWIIWQRLAVSTYNLPHV